MEISRRELKVGESSTAMVSRDFWKTIWNLHIPAVLKFFLWKACNNLLPTKENLYSKKIVQDPLCPLSLQASESVGHILWSCPSSVAAWQECGRCI
jgi:hypothetical protein